MIRTNVHVSAAAAKGYYTEGLSRQDYYSEGQEVAGSWGGEAAKQLGLSGRVEQAAFASLCDNLDPRTGEQLTPRNRTNRRVGYDFNFHCPKSVSVLHALVGDARILDCFRDSVNETMREIEKGMNTRVRRAGAFADRHTGNMAWAEFVHFTGRPVGGIPDPHLHAHCFVFNATFDREERRWKAGEFAGIKNELEFHEAVFHLRLSNRLQQLGYQIERRGKGWEIAAVSKEVIDEFSRRTAQVESIAKEKGITNAKLKDRLGAKSREKKQKALSISELKKAWSGRISEADLAIIHGLGARGPTNNSVDLSAARIAAAHAVEHCFARKSVVAESKLRAVAIRRALGSGVTAAAIDRELENSGVIRQHLNGRTMVTTAAVLAEEQEMIAFARNGRGRRPPLKIGGHRWRRNFLSAEQKAAVAHVLNSTDQVTVIRGGAGTGKTTLMSEAIEGIQAGGRAVFTFAPSAIASRKVLREEGFVDAETVARLLMDEKLQARIRDQVIWVDEAGLLSVRDMLAVFNVAARQNARVILSGDARQHSAVERGDALRLLESSASIRPAEVNRIRRQRGEYKRAIEALSRGDSSLAFDIFDRLGAVREVSADQTAEQLSADYLRALKRGRSALVISPTHSEGARMTEAIRAQLKSNRLLGKTEWAVHQQTNLNWTAAEKSDSATYQPGDVVQFVQNVKGFARGERVVVTGRDDAGNLSCSSLSGVPQKTPLLLDQPERFQVYRRSTLNVAVGERVRITQGGMTKNRCRLENGAIYTVKAFGSEGIEFDNGFKIPWDYGNLAYGYVATSHAAQGRTVDEVLLAQSSESLSASSREQFYVSASRGRERLTIYTDDRTALLEAVGASGMRVSASELVSKLPKKMSIFKRMGIKSSSAKTGEKADATKPAEDKAEGKKSLFEKLGVAKSKEPGAAPIETKANEVKPTPTSAVTEKPGQAFPGAPESKSPQSNLFTPEPKPDQAKHDEKGAQNAWDSKAAKPAATDAVWAAKATPPAQSFPGTTPSKEGGLFAPDPKQSEVKQDQKNAQGLWDSKSVKSGDQPVPGGFADKELQRRANNTDEDYRARAKILNEEAAKNKAIKDVGQKQQELQKRHTATTTQPDTAPATANHVVKGAHTAKLVEERKAAGKPAVIQPASAAKAPTQSTPAPTKVAPVQQTPKPPVTPPPKGGGPKK